MDGWTDGQTDMALPIPSFLISATALLACLINTNSIEPISYFCKDEFRFNSLFSFGKDHILLGLHLQYR